MTAGLGSRRGGDDDGKVTEALDNSFRPSTMALAAAMSAAAVCLSCSPIEQLLSMGMNSEISEDCQASKASTETIWDTGQALRNSWLVGALVPAPVPEYC